MDQRHVAMSSLSAPPLPPLYPSHHRHGLPSLRFSLQKCSSRSTAFILRYSLRFASARPPPSKSASPACSKDARSLCTFRVRLSKSPHSPATSSSSRSHPRFRFSAWVPAAGTHV